MFGLAQLVVMAERDLRDKTLNVRDESHPAPQVWLWRVLFFVASMLVLLSISGSMV
jgi:hypothetical protein